MATVTFEVYKILEKKLGEAEATEIVKAIDAAAADIAIQKKLEGENGDRTIFLAPFPPFSAQENGDGSIFLAPFPPFSAQTCLTLL